ncbi:MAG: methylated-DNA--[protein]-cysteine S-methyltransferase [Treponema sp.]|jgi:methylated-DNA-[protein]-cysteine S-methyltransferase|nr:methylated-DNA--[protein]-cysteine S-methyltransferase [Treponema sp.]
MIYTAAFNTPLGAMTAAAEKDTLTGLWFAGQKYFPRKEGWIEKPAYPVFKALGIWLISYFAGKNPPVNLPLDPPGTAFQKRVWERLRAIPYGKPAAYGTIAKSLGAPEGSPENNYPPSPRAVGGAVGRNPISLLIPCHRVIGADGGLTGYAGGLERKEALLALEGCGTPVAHRL